MFSEMLSQKRNVLMIIAMSAAVLGTLFMIFGGVRIEFDNAIIDVNNIMLGSTKVIIKTGSNSKEMAINGGVSWTLLIPCIVAFTLVCLPIFNSKDASIIGIFYAVICAACGLFIILNAKDVGVGILKTASISYGEIKNAFSITSIVGGVLFILSGILAGSSMLISDY